MLCCHGDCPLALQGVANVLMVAPEGLVALVDGRYGWGCYGGAGGGGLM